MRRITSYILLILVVLPAFAESDNIAWGTQAERQRLREAVEKQAKPNPDMTRQLKALVDKTRTPEWEAEQRKLRQMIAESTGVDIDISAEDKTKVGGSSKRLVVFISRSVPLPVLRSYARHLEKVGGAMIMRGMVNGVSKIGPTTEFIASVLRKDPLCSAKRCAMREVPVLIDPIIYQMYGVNRVPAVTLIDNDNLKQHCEYQSFDVSHAWQVIYGDASLLNHLATLSRLYGAKDVAPIIRRLESRDELG